MDIEQTRRRIPVLQFRVEDIDLTTDLWNNEEPHDLAGKGGGTWFKLLCASLGASMISLPTRLYLTRQWRSVTMVLIFGCF